MVVIPRFYFADICIIHEKGRKVNPKAQKGSFSRAFLL
jgi:hypothetical protein